MPFARPVTAGGPTPRWAGSRGRARLTGAMGAPRAAHRRTLLTLAGGWLLVGIVAGGCDPTGARVGPTAPDTTRSAVPAASPTRSAVPIGSPTPSPVRTAPPSAGGLWGPLAVVPPQDGADTARTEGTLRITDACAFLVTPAGPSLLIWPADRTTWNARTRAVSFANFNGRTVSAGDGTPVVLGGSGDSSDESGITTEEWLAQTPWVARPADSCPLDSRWWVGALTR